MAEQRDVRLRGVGLSELAHRGPLRLGLGHGFVGRGRLGRLHHQPARNPLVQQQLGGADHGIGVKAAAARYCW